MNAEFDLDKYLRASNKVDLSGVGWGRVKEHSLSVAEARTLVYMMDIESFPNRPERMDPAKTGSQRVFLAPGHAGRRRIAQGLRGRPHDLGSGE